MQSDGPTSVLFIEARGKRCTQYKPSSIYMYRNRTYPTKTGLKRPTHAFLHICIVLGNQTGSRNLKRQCRNLRLKKRRENCSGMVIATADVGVCHRGGGGRCARRVALQIERGLGGEHSVGRSAAGARRGHSMKEEVGGGAGSSIRDGQTLGYYVVRHPLRHH